MHISLRSSLALLTLLMPAIALAAPANVTGVTAVLDNENVRVSWQPVAGDIASYRIFYSQESILENNGLFDDFETVDGSVSTHVLHNIPQSDTLTVAILAVDAAGNESPFFVEEATVTLSSSPTSEPSLAITPSLAPPEEETDVSLMLLSAESTSATTVLLTFSHAVSVAPDRALTTVIIEDALSTRLRMEAITASGTQLRITTTEQMPGTIYKVRLNDGITGIDINGKTITLAAEQTPMLFAGYHPLPQPVTPPPVENPLPEPSPTAGPDVSNLTLHAQPVGATFTIEATWSAPSQTINGYELLQTTDGGRTFGPVTNVPTSTTGVRIPDVTAGTFGLFVRAVSTDGTRTSGLTKIIDLPGNVLNPSPLPGNVAGPVQQPTTPPVTTLPSSGPTLWLILMSAGAMVTLRILRRYVYVKKSSHK